MESSNCNAQGISATLREKLFTLSDKFEIFVCDKCGMIAIDKFKTNNAYCKGCNNETYLSRIQLPYACKLLFQELMGMGILPRIRSDKDEYRLEY